MARAYRLGKREAVVEETRERIIDAARQLFSESGFHAVTLDDVARRAGVARATVYYQFESKYGLLDSVCMHTLQVKKAEGLRVAREHEDALAGTHQYVNEVCRFWSGDVMLFRNVYGLAAIDPEAAKLFDGYDDRRRELLMWLAKRLDDQGHLREGMTQRRATDVLWLLTSFRSFDQLNSRAELPVDEAAGLLNELAETILAPASRERFAAMTAPQVTAS
jgi:AcrR family transcriptional regulator